jgi:hypothetical protein
MLTTHLPLATAELSLPLDRATPLEQYKPTSCFDRIRVPQQAYVHLDPFRSLRHTNAHLHAEHKHQSPDKSYARH